jgi:hypothetical protein
MSALGFRTAFLLSGLLLPARSLAWELEGHQAVAYLAQRHLTPAAAATVKDLLGGRDLADVAVWADDIKRTQRPETRPWHYVLIPDSSAAFDDRRDCRNRACVVDTIEDFAALLRKPSAPRRDRIEALEFLVHFVADLHQPLHCENHGDNLSHDIPAKYPRLGLRDFHAVWDTGVVETDMGTDDPRAYARRLDVLATAHENDWNGGTPTSWANESHRIAQQIYRELQNPVPGKLLELDVAYGAAHSALVEQQLARAGLRLAAVLNAALDTASR